ncbi:MAG: pyridoxal-phosphate dependent enzyme [Gemmatimonadetes bacterium]|nr:pyridoxal-phosphate dependent enzyme [Gemmatimonadota bacterium]
MVRLDDIRNAQETIAGRVHRTPLFSSRSLSEEVGAPVFLKAESLQKTGSFKVRGALNRVRRLGADERARGVIGVSAGNHAQGLAWAASLERVPCTVVMPVHAAAAKVAATRAYGAGVVLHGSVFELWDKCQELQREHGYTLVHPFDDPLVIAGQGTVGIEILDDLPNTDAVVVPVGGGGLISGIAAAVKALRPAAKLIGVEPVGAPAVHAALEAGHVVRLERVDTIADGLAPPSTGELALAHVRELVDEMVLVTDDEILHALRFVLQRAKLLLEPAGAAGIAALLAHKWRPPAGARVVAVASGGNVDLPRLASFLQET